MKTGKLKMRIEKISNLFLLTELSSTISSLSHIYPDISHWYNNKVIPRVMLGEDIVIVAKSENGETIGFAIGKKTDKESKLCCLMVLPDFRGRGYALKLINRIIEELDDDYPHCSVSEDLFHIYSKIFINHFRWSLDDVVSDVYQKGKLEYFFNGKHKKESII